jgi:hypothetical protein
VEEIYCSECGNILGVQISMRGAAVIIPCEVCVRKAYDNGADETLELLAEYEKEAVEYYGKN